MIPCVTHIGGGKKIRKRLRARSDWICEWNTVVTPMGQASDTLAAVTALTCPCFIVAAWKNEFVPEICRWRECRGILLFDVLRTVGYRRTLCGCRLFILCLEVQGCNYGVEVLCVCEWRALIRSRNQGLLRLPWSGNGKGCAGYAHAVMKANKRWESR